MKSEVTKEQIHSFLMGSSPMERIIKIEGGYNDDKMAVIYRDENGRKKVLHESYYPFCWAKQSACQQLFNGDRNVIKAKLRQYGIICKGLRICDSEGNVPERMERGYRVLLKAKNPMTYQKFLQFFKEGGRPIFPNQNDVNYGLREYMAVAPNEQFMIETGKRLFKGYEYYDDALRTQFDLETEGLDPKKDAISQIGIRTNKGFEKIIPVLGEGEEKLKNELQALREFFIIIHDIDPDILSGHNVENFDFWFIDERLKLRGSSLEEFTRDIFPHRGIYKAKKQKVLKLGGEMEYYVPTIMWGTNITDSLFAVRRAQAINSNIKKADLKYITKFSKLNKPNRVYVPGKIINSTWVDENKRYAFNNENGHWFKITKQLLEKTITNDNNAEIKRYELLDNNQKLFDKKEEETFDIVSGRSIVERYLLDDLYETDKVENMYNQPNFLVSKMIPVSYEKVCTMGTAAIWKYIMLTWSYENNLAIPEITEKVKFVGGLSRLLSVGYVKDVVKLDYNSLYPSIILTFNIENVVDVMGVLLAILEYVLSMREHYKNQKAEYGDQAKELKASLVNIVNQEEIAKCNEEINRLNRLKTSADTLQAPLKTLGNSYFGGASSGTPFPWTDTLCRGPEQTTCTGRQMLRLMIYHFSHISSFNNQNLSEEYDYKPIVGDTDGFNFQKPKKYRYTEEHPYIGQGKGRNVKKGQAYTGVEADVAEFEDTYIYEAYNGGILKNGLGIDEYCDACIQFRRKNYCDLMPDGSIKLVGNSIKSKKMPIYIEKFINEAIKMLLHEQGKEFIEYYYDYIEKIYNMQIPLKDIASVGKIKISINEYKEKCKEVTKSGTKKARQAWYELAIKENLNVNMGDSIYFINTGTKKGESDVKRVTEYYYIDENGKEIDYLINDNGEKALDKKGNVISLTKYIEKEYKKYYKEYSDSEFAKNRLGFANEILFKDKEILGKDRIIFNCVLLNNELVEDEEDHFCDENFEYNTAKYIEMFNKRIRPLLVVFDRNVRMTVNEKGKEIDNILISNPKDRKTFTEEECKLVSGQPFSETDQDSYEALMTMEDKEIKFWVSSGKTPPYTKECGMDWETIKTEYLERQAKLKEEGIKEEYDKYHKIIDSITENEVIEFIEDGILPEKLISIIDENYQNGTFYSKKWGIQLGTIYDIIDKQFSEDETEEE